MLCILISVRCNNICIYIIKRYIYLLTLSQLLRWILDFKIQITPPTSVFYTVFLLHVILTTQDFPIYAPSVLCPFISVRCNNILVYFNKSCLSILALSQVLRWIPALKIQIILRPMVFFSTVFLLRFILLMQHFHIYASSALYIFTSLRCINILIYIHM